MQASVSITGQAPGAADLPPNIFDTLLISHPRHITRPPHHAGGEAPRRVLCCGYCSGGALAAIAAPWAALAYPGADVRCISFGAPRYYIV